MALLIVALLCLVVVAGGADDATMAEKCSSQFQKVTQCLPFATSKAATPSKDCCESVTDLKEADPACLCFIIQQIHNGSNAAVRSMGVQEARLLQLPSACRLANASVADCPSLLHLPPNSPDAAIFTNVSSASGGGASSSSATTPSNGLSSSTTTPSNGFSHTPQLTPSIAGALAIFLFLHAFPMSS